MIQKIPSFSEKLGICQPNHSERIDLQPRARADPPPRLLRGCGEQFPAQGRHWKRCDLPTTPRCVRLGKEPSVLSHDLSVILAASSARHSHLCPRQVLGARIGLAGASALGLDIPRTDKRLLIFVESDGCFADGVEVATGCTMGHRTLRLEDYGKIAAVFVDVESERAVRLAPRLDVREQARSYAPDERRHYFAQLHAYQIMPDGELLSIQPVSLTTPVAQIVSRPIVRTACQRCGEEIINEREVVAHGQTFCRSCAGPGYYHPEAENHLLFARHTEGREVVYG